MDNLQTSSRIPKAAAKEEQGEGEDGAGGGKLPGIDVHAYYIDRSLKAFRVSAAQLYSHTPKDFDYKLSAGELKLEGDPFDTPEALAAHLKETADVVFPTVHGRWGEDGGLAAVLEDAGVPFVGTPSAAATLAYDKARLLLL